MFNKFLDTRYHILILMERNNIFSIKFRIFVICGISFSPNFLVFRRNWSKLIFWFVFLIPMKRNWLPKDLDKSWIFFEKFWYMNVIEFFSAFWYNIFFITLFSPRQIKIIQVTKFCAALYPSVNFTMRRDKVNFEENRVLSIKIRIFLW